VAGLFKTRSDAPVDKGSVFAHVLTRVVPAHMQRLATPMYVVEQSKDFETSSLLGNASP
jgi:hypothetical protein